jgi:hypothetical protein
MLCIYMIMSSNSSNKRENIEQIPKEEKIGEVQKVVSEQGGVEGQRKEVSVGDYVKAAALRQLLKKPPPKHIMAHIIVGISLRN